MDDPPHEDDPEQGGKNELNDRFEQTALQQLSESRDEEAAKRGDDIPCGTLACHVVSHVDDIVLYEPNTPRVST